MLSESIVIVGGGHAAAQLCASLVELGQGANIHLVCEEDVLPYQRPPLSKAFFKKADESIQMIKAQAWFDQHGIQVHLANPATHLNPVKKELQLRSGLTLPYGKLVLATGTRARTLPAIPQGTENVHFLRTAKDAQALRDQFSHLSSFTLIGGGFIGLELAATFNALGKKVTVLEVAPRLLARSISPHLSEHVLQTHLSAGVDIRMQSNIKGFEFEGHRLTRIELETGHLDTECVLVGIGAVAEEALALQAGLTCSQGVVVDESLRTSDPHIWAIGDCTRFPYHANGESLRLESIQNANDQARIVAQNLCGQASKYQPTPWFWSEQGAMRLQMVGLFESELTQVMRPGANAQSFSLFHYKHDTLQCVETVNSPMDHMMAKKMFEQKVSPPPTQVSDPNVPLKSLVA